MTTHLPTLGAKKLAREAGDRLANQIEDALAGLLINGVDAGSIEVQKHPEHRTIISVDGLAKYEFKIVFTQLDT